MHLHVCTLSKCQYERRAKRPQLNLMQPFLYSLTPERDSTPAVIAPNLWCPDNTKRARLSFLFQCFFLSILPKVKIQVKPDYQTAETHTFNTFSDALTESLMEIPCGLSQKATSLNWLSNNLQNWAVLLLMKKLAFLFPHLTLTRLFWENEGVRGILGEPACYWQKNQGMGKKAPEGLPGFVIKLSFPLAFQHLPNEEKGNV